MSNLVVKRWSKEKHIETCIQIAKLYGFEIAIRSTDAMPKVERVFLDVHVQDHTIWVENDSRLVWNLWHEIGHLIAATASERAGVNWNDSNEYHAVEASASIIRLLRMPMRDRVDVLSYVNAYNQGMVTHKQLLKNFRNHATVRPKVRSTFKALTKTGCVMKASASTWYSTQPQEIRLLQSIPSLTPVKIAERVKTCMTGAD